MAPVLPYSEVPPPIVVAPRCVSGKGLGKWGGGALKSGVGNSRALRFSQESQSPILNASVGHDQFVNLWGYGDSLPGGSETNVVCFPAPLALSVSLARFY